MGESECDYRGILAGVKRKLSSFLHLKFICFLFVQNKIKHEKILQSKKSVVRLNPESRLTKWLNSVDLTQLASTKMAKSETANEYAQHP